MTESRFIIKVYFVDEEKQVLGLFYIFIHAESYLLITSDAVVTSQSELKPISSINDITTMRNTMSSLKFKGTCIQTMTADLQKSILDLPKNGDIFQDIIRSVQDNNLKQTKSLLINYLKYTLALKINDLVVNISTEEFTLKSDNQNNISESSSNNNISVLDESLFHNNESVFLNLELVTDPIKGKPIQNILEDQYVLVYIISGTSLADFYIDNFKLRGKDNITPCVGKIIKKNQKDKQAEMLVEIHRNVYGYIYPHENLLICIPNETMIYEFHTRFNQDSANVSSVSFQAIDNSNQPKQTFFSNLKETVSQSISIIIVVIIFLLLTVLAVLISLLLDTF